MIAGSRNRRVAILVTRMDLGGVPDHIMTLVEGLVARYDVALICNHIDQTHQAEIDALGVKVIPLPMQRLLSGVSDLKALGELRRILREGGYDILHTHMSKAALLGAMVGVTSRRPKVVNTAHNLGYIAMQSRWKKAVFWAYDRIISSLGHDATIVVSDTIARQARAAGLIPKDRLHTIHNGIRVSRFDGDAIPREGLKSDVLGDACTDGPLLICVARLVWFKGLDALIAALPQVGASHPDARLLLVGDGELRDALAAQARALGVEHMVVFAGERQDVPDLLALADLFVLPSVSEGMPISLLEAMACKLPLVATSVGGIPELIIDGKTGRLVDRGDAAGLADALTAYLDDPAMMKRHGAEGHKRLEAEFSQAAMVERTEAVYDVVLNETPALEARHV